MLLCTQFTYVWMLTETPFIIAKFQETNCPSAERLNIQVLHLYYEIPCNINFFRMKWGTNVELSAEGRHSLTYRKRTPVYAKTRLWQDGEEARAETNLLGCYCNNPDRR